MLDAANPELARRYGRFLMFGAALAGLLYTIGIARRAYWAVILPGSTMVAIGLAAASILGRLLATTPGEPPDPE
jgi:hypothetical protein